MAGVAWVQSPALLHNDNTIGTKVFLEKNGRKQFKCFNSKRIVTLQCNRIKSFYSQ